MQSHSLLLRAKSRCEAGPEIRLGYELNDEAGEKSHIGDLKPNWEGEPLFKDDAEDDSEEPDAKEQACDQCESRYQ